MGALKGKELETALFSVAVLLNGFLLWKAVHLKFMVRNMLGPGAYPTAVLVIALVISIVLLVQVVRRREIRVLSPFLGGSPLDVRVKRLCAAATGLGQPVRIVSRTGVGRFSAFARGIASADGAVTVVTSALAEISNLHAAAFALRNFSPVLCIDHDPDMLVARDGSPWMDAATVLTHRGTLRVGIAQTAEESSPVEAWLGKAANLDLAPTYDEDWQNLVEALRGGDLDVVVVPFTVGAEPAFGNDLRRLGVFAEDTFDGIPPVPPIDGTPLLSGRWTGLAVTPDTPAEHREFLVRGFVDAARTTWPHAAPQPEAEAFKAFLERRDACRSALFGTNLPEPRLGPDKRTGLIAAVLATFAFPYAMGFLGFPLTAFLFLAGLMSILWPRFEARALVHILPLAVALALGLQALFGGVFHVVFPEGSLTGF